MSVVKYSTGVVPSIGGKLANYKGETHSCVWKTRGITCLHNFYNLSYDETPDVGIQVNGFAAFLSRKPNSAIVDWGDGNVERFEFSYIESKGFYSLIFRSLTFPYQNIGNDGEPKVFDYGDEFYAGIPPHIYSDGNDETERTISIVFDRGFYFCRFNVVDLSEFPNIVSSEINDFRLDYTNDKGWFSDIPFEYFNYIPNLTKLSLVRILRESTDPIPNSIFDLSNLISLDLSGSFDLSDIERSGIRNINKLKSLEALSLEGCFIPKYIKEFNDIPNLYSLNISSFKDKDGFSVNDSPGFDEVEYINQSIRILSIFSAYGTNRRTDINIGLYGKGIGNIIDFRFLNLRYWDIDKIPDYVYEMRSLVKTDFSYTSIGSQERADRLIDKWYEHVTSWEYITKSQIASDGNRNQYYGISINWRILDPTPSGVLQAPQGFELGVQDGNPSTPMEKIYVLENNYKQVFNLV